MSIEPKPDMLYVRGVVVESAKATEAQILLAILDQLQDIDRTLDRIADRLHFANLGGDRSRY